ncbi:D-alanyl-D-alanine carboxypeptidase [Bifidobacterium platyrrhinorum]|uniref:D-alanyl-D-alanine carboxypeptidase n=1 Tax=Bifidobacterium platyrrhinorum TaxID=2661628 RepID=A0A6L9STD2_9BIFI|nr:D-alanyl-D-alanine carboxypeptidase [Bifidobacterium platyrrhinorum]NEG55820.1 D-alanyl-D-alanine carboxypeptidase [Bifidobacterium platyrrhinorum]
MADNGRTASPARHRVAVCATCVALTLATGIGYTVADVFDVAPGMLTLDPVAVRTYPDPASTVAAGVVAGDADADKPVDKAQAARLIETLGKAEGVGSDYSVVIADAKGNVVAEHEAGTAREPASTTKTLTAFAAASTLEMGSTLDTSTYLTHASDNPTVVLKGGGDMLLGLGESDPSHVNGRAGLATLARRTADALKAKGITSVAVAADDTLFGDDRTPTDIDENNGENRYYTPISSMAVDGGRDWTGLAAEDPDEFTDYPMLSQSTADDAAAAFKGLLAQQGIQVLDSQDVSGVGESARLAKVSSAPLNEVLAFMLRHSDNTLAELFGRLTALKLGTGNSIDGDVKAVAKVLGEHGVSTEGMHLTSCSGLAPGTTLTVLTLAQVQSKYVDPDGGAAAASEGLALPGLVGTVRNRVGDDSARGLLRVKTGALDTVRSLVGNVSRADGGVLTFAAIVNNPSNGWSANQALDAFAASLTKL